MAEEDEPEVGSDNYNYDPYSNEEDSEKAQEGKERFEKRKETKQTNKNDFCPHVLVVAEKIGKLRSFIATYKKACNKMGNIISANLSKQLGGKPNQRAKQRRGKNNVSKVSVVSEEDPYDVMLPKPMRYIEY